jgi:RNA methyltransferase, TrmH family
MAPAFEQITSFQNSRVKQVRRLRERRARDREARFVIDDTRDLLRALDCGYHVDYVLYCPELDAGDPLPLDRLPPDAIFQVSREIMEKVSYRQNPSAVVAVMEQKPPGTLDDLRAQAGPLVLGLVDLQKPGNIGALLRTADATGFNTICLIDTALDIYNPNVIRSSTGACFLGNIYALNTAEALAFFREADYRIVAAVVEGHSAMFETDFGGRVALVLGTEDRGLPQAWIDAADARVRIPMVGRLADSLNVSVSGAVLMYEVLRQRWTL